MSKVRPASDAAQSAAAQVQDTLRRAWTASGLDGGDGPAAGIRRTIDDALASAGLAPSPEDRSAAADATQPQSRTDPAPDQTEPARARGTSHVIAFAHPAGNRNYTLYVPPGLDDSNGDGVPLMVMLHGCTQSSDDFATGTRMNALADSHGVLVAYPEQTARDNGSRCWNWFRAQDQQRGGEPAVLAGIVEDIARRHRVDPRRVYVAGLSAGAAMAVILGRTYPEVFAAVGAHSGLPFAAARDMSGAFAAMQGRGAARSATPGNAQGIRVPTIVIHGTADRTVAVDNGRAIVEDAIAAGAGARPLQPGASLRETVNGRDMIRSEYRDDEGRVWVTHVEIDGAGHAWSGGDPAGSHTDGKGPDASALILQFCLRQTR